MTTSEIPAPRLATMLPQINNNPDPGPDPGPLPPAITITAPVAGATVSGAEPGVPLTVTGTYRATGYLVPSISVTVDGISYPATLSSTTAWSAPVRLYRNGSDTLTATLTVNYEGDPVQASASRAFTAALTSTVPVLTVSQPAPNQTVALPETGGILPVAATSNSATFGYRQLRASCGTAATDLQLLPPASYTGDLYLAPTPLGARQVVVTCTDPAGNVGSRTVTINVTDANAPHPQVSYPTPGLVIPSATATATIQVTGTATDVQSGMAGGRATVTVALSTNGPNLTATPVNGSFANWTLAVPVTAYGAYTLYVTATDAAGNVSPAIAVPFQVVSTYVPATLQERLDGRAYLAALLEFAQEQVTTPQGALSTDQLIMALGQKYNEISQPASAGADKAKLPVNQLRVPVELLRWYITTHAVPTVPGAAGETAYLSTAYNALLAAAGSSYTELRLARGASTADRQALAARLGITLPGTRPDLLDDLVKEGPAPAEARLQALFGLPDTTSDHLTDGVLDGQLLLAQRTAMQAGWAARDRAPAGQRPFPVLVDPDLVGAGDAIAGPAGDPVRRLVADRAAALSAFAGKLDTARRAAATAAAGLTAMVNLALPGVDLAGLETAEQAGTDIGPALAAAQLTREGFGYLRQLARFATSGVTVTDGEWADAVNVLVGVYKRGLTTTWRGQESGISLSPLLFVPGQPAPVASPYRADPVARAAWQDLLAARAAQYRALDDAAAGAVAAAEQAALPLLRDALLTDIAAATGTAAPPGTGDIGERMTGYLQLDVKAAGTLVTTRQAQAIESLQSLLFAIRSGELPAGHPATGWTLPAGRGAFDAAWRWMGDQGGWQAAIQTFLFPERSLDPALLHVTPSDPWDALRSAIAGAGPFTAADAATAAATYLAARRAASPAVPAFSYLDPLHTAAHQSSLAGLSATLAKTDANLACEVFWGVPLLLAQRLQSAGEYLAALDWFWLVYPYDAVVPGAFMSAYHVVNTELSTTPVHPDLTFKPGWTDHLNPFELVTGRPAPFSRYTLLAAARCHIEFADAEFTRETDASVARARELYLTAAALLAHPCLVPVAPASKGEPTLAIPDLTTLTAAVGVQLAKLRQGRNIAGMPRTQSGTGSAGLSQPTPYRYKVLLERGRQLVAQAVQVEAGYLAALEKYDNKTLQVYDAQKALDVAGAQVDLQTARVAEAGDAITAAADQGTKAAVLVQTYAANIAAPPNRYEASLLNEYRQMRSTKDAIAVADTVIGVAQAASTATNMFSEAFSFGGAGIAGAAMGAASVAKGIATGVLDNLEAQMQANQLMAGIEQRRAEWRTQLAGAQQDVAIAAAQVRVAQDQLTIAVQEQSIATLQQKQAADTLKLLTTQFTNADLYQWMGRTLGQVYRYFLQQATATARLAQAQLAFERAERPQQIVQNDYWQSPAELSATGTTQDRAGMTGAERLQADIARLDEYAFATDRRRLNLSQTLSLAQLMPAEFLTFRDTGQLRFATPMSLFDADFPGHYLRLVRQVRVSLVALVPPNRGVRATLSCNGISRVTTPQGAGFADVVLRRDPASVALTSPVNATGTFDLDTQADLLLPFEGNGVDTTWQLDLPAAANPFDFGTIADVLITLEFTALSDVDYRARVVERLNAARDRGADCVFSLAQDFPDQWYALNNPDPAVGRAVTLSLRDVDFPPHLSGLATSAVTVRLGGADLPATAVTLRRGGVGGTATTSGGVAGTRRGAAAWAPICGPSPVGDWQLSFGPDADALFGAGTGSGAIDDVLLMIGWAGQAPAWPA